jgi:hypothetical protein
MLSSRRRSAPDCQDLRPDRSETISRSRFEMGDAMPEHAHYVVLECVENLPQYPRYGFATAKHAEELGLNVKQLQICASLELAATIVDELNGGKRPHAGSSLSNAAG